MILPNDNEYEKAHYTPLERRRRQLVRELLVNVRVNVSGDDLLGTPQPERLARMTYQLTCALAELHYPDPEVEDGGEGS